MKIIEIVFMSVVLLFVLYTLCLAAKRAFKKNADKTNNLHQEYFWFIVTGSLWSLFFLFLCSFFVKDKKIGSFLLFFFLCLVSSGIGYFLLLKWKQKEGVHH
ncbi:MAG: hypothetical protein Q8N59_02360 [bacterium]|nr:hypothetical protein [bacterium]